MKNKNKILIFLNIIFLLYYSIQLLVFTDEFAIRNLGSFNHAIAGLSEIVGIVFLVFSITLLFILKNGFKKQFPIFFTIILIQILIFLNFLKYIFTNSPGETSIISIQSNALLFFIGIIANGIFIIINYDELK